MCVCVCTGFCSLFRTFSGTNTDCVRINSPHGEQRSVLMRHDLICEVLVKLSRAKAQDEVRLRLG